MEEGIGYTHQNYKPHITKERFLNWAKGLSDAERVNLTGKAIRTVFKCSRQQADNALTRWIPIVIKLKNAESQTLEYTHHSPTREIQPNSNTGKVEGDFMTYMSTRLRPGESSIESPSLIVSESHQRAANQVIRHGLPIRLDTFMSLLSDAEKVVVTPRMLSDLFDVSPSVAERLYHREILPFIREVHMKSVDPVMVKSSGTPNKGLSLLTDDLSSDVIDQEDSNQRIVPTRNTATTTIRDHTVDGDQLRRSAALSLLINNADSETLRQVVTGLILNNP